MKKSQLKNGTTNSFAFETLDKYQLDDEWINQDRLVGHYGEELARARRRFEQVKTACQIYEAETARRIRRKPGQYNVQKLTEASIKEAVAIEVLMSQEHDRLIEAKFKVELLEVAMRRLEHRKKALSDMVYLHGQQYFSQPVMPKDLNQQERIRQKRTARIGGLRDED